VKGKEISMTLPTPEQLEVDRLGEPLYASPLRSHERFVDEADRVLVGAWTSELSAALDRGAAPPAFERAGPRSELFFHPARISCGVVTCGGLCPGENDVIRSLVLKLTHSYGVQRILGYRFGYAGLSATPPEPPVELTLERVEGLHGQGGSVLASSRGPQDVASMVETLDRQRVDVLFAIGGDGTLRGAAAIADEIARRELDIAVVGIPKTVDNDLEWIDRSFGFSTAVEEARRAIAAAHIEARGVWNGVGLLEVMGRHSGFIAAHACLANPDVNFCLVPEVPFPIEGACGLLWALERRLEARRHAVLVVAEGAARDVLQGHGAPPDASGNLRLRGVGALLRDRIEQHFSEHGSQINVKYIDPSYLIRSGPANAADSELCLRLGQHAVHAAMAGRTRVLVGSWHGHFTHVPIALATAGRRQIDPSGPLWGSVLEATGQHMSLHGQRQQDLSPAMDRDLFGTGPSRS
jgi:6-phosphofructokinase 1